MSFFNIIVILLLYYMVVRPLFRALFTNQRFPHMKENPYKSAKVLRAIYVVAREVAHADGEETQEEIDMVVHIIRQSLGRPDLSSEHIIAEYHRHSTVPWSDTDADGMSFAYRRNIFIVAINVAISDHKVTGSELLTLRKIAARLHLPNKLVDELLTNLENAARGGNRSFEGNSMSASEFAYQVLGLEKGATSREIKKAYQRMAMKHHPDKAPEGKKEEATERFKEVGDAYKILKELNS